MTSKEIRQQFLDFFASKEHTIVASSPVVPHDDPTLMFTNAGMNQFKDVFLGTGSRSYSRAADTQKCIRAGGKHNDLDDVGQDTYHHTFFEMLGNWSFGDYFKKEAIRWAWELMTGVWGIEKDRLHATYFEGDEAEGLEPDTEAADLWKTVTDIDPTHVHPGNKKDNFWEMGETGPCGPCSEIHIDLTPDKSGATLVNAGDPRVIELWNLVFIQFNRANDGKLSPLPAKHVDTGMGFERLCATLQGMEQGRLGAVTNYDTDVFTPLFDAIREVTGAPAYAGTLPKSDGATEGDRGGSTKRRSDGGEIGDDAHAVQARNAAQSDSASPPEPQASACADAPNLRGAQNDEGSRGLKPAAQGNSHERVMIDVSYRVIADHLRCLTFAITDGAMPSNEGRGYVLRRILRRAVRYGRQYMNMHEPFLCRLVTPLVDLMGDAFTELHTAHGGKNIHHVEEILRDEEESFGQTWDRGITMFHQYIENSLLTVVDEFLLDRYGAFEPEIDAAFEREGWDEIDLKYADWARDVVDPVLPASLNVARRDNDVWLLNENREPVERIGALRITGDAAFKLHDTFGFPIDLTELMAKEAGISVDISAYEHLMEEAREKARTGTKVNATMDLFIAGALPRTDDRAKYSRLSLPIRILGFVVEGEFIDKDPLCATDNRTAALVLDQTCAYAEQGGQVGDVASITTDTGEFLVDTCKKLQDSVLHIGSVQSGKIIAGQHAKIAISEMRHPTMQNHTSTHIMNWALREVLCPAEERERPHVQQKGSLVDPEKTRFDFSHNKPLTDEEIVRIEDLCNEQIAASLPVFTDEVDQAKAREINTLRAVFGEKYPDVVRVVSIGAPITEEQAKESGMQDWLLQSPKSPEWMKYSVEFCGGTHLTCSSEAERFVLTTEEGVAKGIRRVVGISGEAARQGVALGEQLLADVRALAGKPPVAPDQYRDREGADEGAAEDAVTQGNQSDVEDLAAKLASFQQRLADAVIPLRVRREIQTVLADVQKTAKEQQKQAAADAGGAVKDKVASLLAGAEEVGGVKIVVGEVPPANADALRDAIDWIRNKTGASAVLLVTHDGDKVTLIAGMSKVVVKKGVKAGDLIKEIAPLVGGRGGGRPDMAQGGGNDASGISKTIDRANAWFHEKLT